MSAIGLELSTDTELAAVAVASREGDGEHCQVDVVFYGPAEGAAGEAVRLAGQPGWGGCGVYVDPMPSAGLLAPLRAAGVSLHLLEAVDVAAAAYEFKAAVRGRRVTAGAHEALREAMRFAARRPLAAAFAFERRRVEADMSALNAAAFAVWGLLHGQAPFFASWR
jgi:hypothetical protein